MVLALVIGSGWAAATGAAIGNREPHHRMEVSAVPTGDRTAPPAAPPLRSPEDQRQPSCRGPRAHVDGFDLVVNLDPPGDHKDYLHRGGRTARAGESGTVVTLALPNQRREMARMMTTAAITPVTTRVSAGDEELARITGARVPTGIPTVIAAPVVERPRRSPSTSRSRPAPVVGGATGTAAVGRAGQGSAGLRRAPRRVALAAWQADVGSSAAVSWSGSPTAFSTASPVPGRSPTVRAGRIPVAGEMVRAGGFLQEQDEIMVRSLRAAADSADTRTASEMLAQRTAVTATSHQAPQLSGAACGEYVRSPQAGLVGLVGGSGVGGGFLSGVAAELFVDAQGFFELVFEDDDAAGGVDGGALVDEVAGAHRDP